MENFKTFSGLSEQKAKPNVVISIRGEVKEETILRQEVKLEEELWEELLVDGCRTERPDSLATTCRAQVHQPPDFDNTFESAWAIVDCILQKNPQETGQQPSKSQHNTNHA